MQQSQPEPQGAYHYLKVTWHVFYLKFETV